jgi:hypothetical protein
VQPNNSRASSSSSSPTSIERSSSRKRCLVDWTKCRLTLLVDVTRIREFNSCRDDLYLPRRIQPSTGSDGFERAYQFRQSRIEINSIKKRCGGCRSFDLDDAIQNGETEGME